MASKDLNGEANENKLFDDFNLKVETREFVIIIGSSGSEKPTLLNKFYESSIRSGEFYIKNFQKLI